MLINKDPDKDVDLNVALGSFAASGGTLYRYSSADAGAIVHEPFTASGSSAAVKLPAYSITLLDLAPEPRPAQIFSRQTPARQFDE